MSSTRTSAGSDSPGRVVISEIAETVPQADGSHGVQIRSPLTNVTYQSSPLSVEPFSDEDFSHSAIRAHDPPREPDRGNHGPVHIRLVRHTVLMSQRGPGTPYTEYLILPAGTSKLCFPHPSLPSY